MELNIHFEDQDSFKMDTNQIKSWLNQTAKSELAEIKHINYIFCSDEYLLKINKEYLDHDYFTDIITFDNSDDEDDIEGDIFISIDRVKENSNDHGVSFENELHRVMIHGVLHLIGYHDETEEEKEIMRAKESTYLSLLNI